MLTSTGINLHDSWLPIEALQPAYIINAPVPVAAMREARSSERLACAQFGHSHSGLEFEQPDYSRLRPRLPFSGWIAKDHAVRMAECESRIFLKQQIDLLDCSKYQAVFGEPVLSTPCTHVAK